MDKERLHSDLLQAEGLRMTAYKDTRGFWTAGVGHLLPQDQDWTGHVFTTDTVMRWLDEDSATAGELCKQLLEWPCLDTGARQNAVVELVFNLGLVHWKGFAHARMAITKKDWQTAHDQLLDSAWSKQVGTKRSTRIANYLRQGAFS